MFPRRWRGGRSPFAGGLAAWRRRQRARRLAASLLAGRGAGDHAMVDARARLVNMLVLRDAAVRAGFHFALAPMWRNKTHRLTLACAAAGGLAMAVVVLSNAMLARTAWCRCACLGPALAVRRVAGRISPSRSRARRAARELGLPVGVGRSRRRVPDRREGRRGAGTGGPGAHRLVAPVCVCAWPVTRRAARGAGTGGRDGRSSRSCCTATTRCHSPARICRART